MNIIKPIALGVLLATLPVAGGAQSIPQVQSEAQDMMGDAMNDVIRDIEGSPNGKILISSFTCPKVIMAIAAVGSGAVDPKFGKDLVFRALVSDQADMVSAMLTRGPMMDFAKGNPVAVSFDLTKGVEKDDLIGLAKAGLSVLK